VAYCHCGDCKRWTGSPLPAFAAFATSDLVITPRPASRSHATGVERWNCPDCGSPLAATFAYLPDAIYVPLGLLDQAGELGPKMHAHAGEAYDWLHLSDDLPRHDGSARTSLNGVTP